MTRLFHPFRVFAFLALLLCCPAAFTAEQAPALVLDGSQSSLSLAGRSSYWVDDSGERSVEQLEQQVEPAFQLRRPGHRLLLKPGAVLWVRFDADRKSVV